MIITESNWAENEAELGGKALNLFKLRAQKIRVPQLVAIPTRYFQEHLKKISNFNALIQALDFTSPQKLSETSSKLREAIFSTPISTSLSDHLSSLLETEFKFDSYLAVRSSAVGEDSSNQSFAGQMDSFLFCQGLEDVLIAVKKCWASLYSDRALTYRRSLGLSNEGLSIAVVIQEMIEGQVSGVCFTVNPLSQNPSEILVNATFGLGEGIVSGALNTDQFVVQRGDLRVLDTQVVEKTTRVSFDRSKGRGTVEEDVPLEQASLPSMSEGNLRALAAEAVKIESAYGLPQDIEWTISGNDLFILQTRPVTTLTNSKIDFGTQRIEADSYETIWDNSNIVESYSGVTTPLTYSFANHCYYMVYVQFCEILGVPKEKIQKLDFHFKNMLGLLRGRIYYNLKNWYRLISVLPGYNYNKDFMEQMMGVKEKTTFVPDEETTPSKVEKYFVELPRLTFVGFTLFYRFLSLDRDVGKFITIYQEVYQKYRHYDFDSANLHRLAEIYNELERRVLRNWKPPIVNDFMAMIFYGVLKSMIQKWRLDTTGSLQNKLLSDQGNVESTLPIKRLQEIAAFIKASPELKSRFLNETKDQLCQSLLNRKLELKSEQQLQIKIEAYLDEFGSRCMNELKLEEPSLNEKPEFVFSILKNYVNSPDFEKAEGEKESELAFREACQKLKGKFTLLVIPRVWIFSFVVNFAKKAVRVREYQRFARTNMFGIMRNLFKAAGRKMHGLGVLDQPQDIFYLTREEILGAISGASVTQDLRSLSLMRKKEFEGFQSEDDLPDRLSTRGAVFANVLKPKAEPVIDMNGALKGTSCCPGKVRGKVKVILKPSDDMSLNGEILVAGRTDPGWVTLYPSAKGLLIERGSVLSHSAIVARELGLPAIVGIPNITKILKTGDWVEMDGETGIVKQVEG